MANNAATAEFLASRQYGGSGYYGVNAAHLNAEFAQRLQNLITAAEAATGSKVRITEGYRPASVQAQYWANNSVNRNGRAGYPAYPAPITYQGVTYYPQKAGGKAAPPGHSNHQSGMAVDIASGPAQTWMRQHAAEYGIHWYGPTDSVHFDMPAGDIAAAKKVGTLGPIPPGSIPQQVASAPPIPLPTTGLRAPYLTGDGGLGYASPPRLPAAVQAATDLANAPPLPRPSPITSSGIFPAVPSNARLAQEQAYSAAPVPAFGSLSTRNMPVPLPIPRPDTGLPPAYNALTPEQRQAIAAVPVPGAPSIADRINYPQIGTGGYTAADFYSGFPLQAPRGSALANAGALGAQAPWQAPPPDLSSIGTTPGSIQTAADAAGFYSGFGLAPAMDAINKAIGVSPAQASSDVPPTPYADGVANIDPSVYSQVKIPGADALSSAAPPVPMDRLRVTPAEADQIALSNVQQFLAGSKVNLSSIPEAQQIALMKAMPTLAAMQNDPKGMLNYLQSTGLYEPLTRVVPTTRPNLLQQAWAMANQVALPSVIPTDMASWGLISGADPNQAAAVLNKAMSSAADQFRRPISASDGVTTPPPNVPQTYGPAGGYYSPPTASSSNSSWAQPYYSALGSSSPPAVGDTAAQLRQQQANYGSWAPYLGSTPPPPIIDSSYAQLLSLADRNDQLPASVNVPKYIDIVKQVPVPASQPIETGDGVHWDPNAGPAGNYVLDAPAPAPKPTYKSVTVQQLNPAWVKAQAALKAPIAPVVPLSPPEDELRALREAQMNPFQRLFNASPLGHVVNFFNGSDQAYGGTTGGLLSMFARGMPSGGGGLLGALSQPAYKANNAASLINLGLTPSQANTYAAGGAAMQGAYPNPVVAQLTGALNRDTGSIAAPSTGGVISPFHSF